MKAMILSSGVMGSFGFGGLGVSGRFVSMVLTLAVLILMVPVFGSSDIGSFSFGDSGFGSSGVVGSGIGGLALFCSFSMALRRILKTACIRDSENRSLTAISVISFTNEVDRILLGVLDAVVRILGFELSLEGSKRILQIAHQ